MHLRPPSFFTLRAPCSLLLCLLLSSCNVPPTPYQPMARDGGYTQARTGPDSYDVNFAGNDETDYSRAVDFATLRAAEIGTQLGYTWFVIEGQTDNSQRTVVSAPSSSTTIGNVGPYGTFVGTTTYMPNQRTLFRPGIVLAVTYYHDKPAGKFLDNSVHNVADTLATLRARYNLSADLTPLPPPTSGNATTASGNTTAQR